MRYGKLRPGAERPPGFLFGRAIRRAVTVDGAGAATRCQSDIAMVVEAVWPDRSTVARRRGGRLQIRCWFVAKARDRGARFWLAKGLYRPETWVRARKQSSRCGAGLVVGLRHALRASGWRSRRSERLVRPSSA